MPIYKITPTIKVVDPVGRSFVDVDFTSESSPPLNARLPYTAQTKELLERGEADCTVENGVIKITAQPSPH